MRTAFCMRASFSVSMMARGASNNNGDGERRKGMEERCLDC